MRDTQTAFSFLSTPISRSTPQGSRVTSDGRLTLLRKLDERLGVGELIEQHSNRLAAVGKCAVSRRCID
jgi:hypothetical protein